MMQLSIRGVDEKLSAALKREAKRRDTSVNKTIIRLLAEAVGTAPQQERPAIHHELDHLFGVWTTVDAAEFGAATACFEEIDEEMWR